jgi:endonuclease/exonuclease/phosphatase family metal-dependent hydrolase
MSTVDTVLECFLVIFSIFFGAFLLLKLINKFYFGPSTPPPGRQDSSVNLASLKILQLNVCWRPNIFRRGKNEYARARASLLLEKVRQYDVVCLSGAYSFVGSPVASFVKSMQAIGFHYFARTHSARLFSLDLLDGGNIIFSKTPILATSCLCYELSINIDQWIGKGAVYARVQTGPGTHVHIWLTHPQANNGAIDTCRAVRFAQLRQMMAPLRKQSSDGQPIVILGDLNLNALAPAVSERKMANEYQRLLDTIPMESYTVTDPMIAAFGEHLPTYGDDERILTTPEDVGSRQRLDYIMLLSREDGEYTIAGQTLEVVKFEVAKQPFTHLSDHYGLQADILLSRRAGDEV